MKPQKLKKLQQELQSLENEILTYEKEHAHYINQCHPEYRVSAVNLLHYLAMRKKSRVKLQRKLGYLGITRLARSQPHIHDSISKSRVLMSALLVDDPVKIQKPRLSIKKSYRRMTENSRSLLGDNDVKRRVRIMVTLPTEAGDNYEMVLLLAESGMNVARINCAHDNPETWKKMIDHVRRASTQLGEDIKISMDLGGPKVRTGEIKPGPAVRQFSPKTDDFGRVIQPARIMLVPEDMEDAPANAIPLSSDWLNQLKPDDKIHILDTRQKEANLEIAQIDEKGVLVYCYTSIYISPDTFFSVPREGMDSITIRHLPRKASHLLLREGDHLIIHRSTVEGERTLFDDAGNTLQEAHISCSYPGLFDVVKKGETIFFDDGKIGGEIVDIYDGYFRVRIQRVKKSVAKLKADKGINLPYGIAHLRGLTSKDEKDLEFVVKHADIVNVSFVNRPEDVRQLHQLLEKLEAPEQLGVILKIETREAFNLLPEILLEAIKKYPVGVMIARGDLAIEVGWDEIGLVQQEILNVCSAAHIPVIWATQVLESLTKQGVPSRSEITDATQSMKAECIMLNKGPYTHRAVALLDKIFTEMRAYQFRNETLLPKLKKLKVPA